MCTRGHTTSVSIRIFLRASEQAGGPHPQSMWSADQGQGLRTGTASMSPALEGGFLTTGPPGKSAPAHFK